MAMEKITLYTLQVDGYGEEMASITLPLMKYYASKIGADFVVIKERRWPDLPPVMEKFQVYYLAQENGSDWNIFFDLDTLIHPEFWNPLPTLSRDTVSSGAQEVFQFPTSFLTKDTTCSGISSDFVPIRFRPNQYFLRDGRFIGKGNWCGIFSNWCLDYYHPPEPMTVEHIEEMAQNIRLTVAEQNSGVMKPSHLIDDYIVSNNIARYGLKHTLISEIGNKFGVPTSHYLWHQYLHDMDKKIVMMRKQLEPSTQTNPNGWGVQLVNIGNGHDTEIETEPAEQEVAG